MTHKALIRQLQISCLGLDHIDPLRLLVDDVIEALAQTERSWVGLTDDDKKQIKKEANYHWEMTAGEYAERIGQLTEAKLREKNSQHKEKNT